jgi:Mg2+/Co2+ transporter CorB
MDTAFWLTLGAVILLLTISGFFSGSETALTAVSRARIHSMAQEGASRAQVVDRLLAHPERIIGTVLLGNNLVNILASALTTSLLISLFGEAGVVYATLALTLIIVVFCEVLPKTYAIAYPEKFSLTIGPIMRSLIWILWPFTTAIDAIVQRILALTPTNVDDRANILAAKEELRGTIELSRRDGAMELADVNRLGGVLDLKELQVFDIMVHRTRMTTLNADDSSAKIIEDILKSAHTRLPIWRDRPDNIIGVLHTKDLLAALSEADWNPEAIDPIALASEPWFVPETTSVNDQLNAFLKVKAQLALIVDEYGEVAGADHARRHPRGNRRRDHRRIRHRRCGGGNHPVERRHLHGRGRDDNPRSQPGDGLEPARRRGQHDRGPRDPRGADDPERGPAVFVPRLSF